MEYIAGIVVFLIVGLLFVRRMWARVDSQRKTQPAPSPFKGMTTHERLQAAGRFDEFSAAAKRRDADALADILRGVEMPEEQAIIIAETVAAEPERYGFSQGKIEPGAANPS